MADDVPEGGTFMKFLRFLNVLEEEKNVLSPTKINVWAANTTTMFAGVATILQWLGGHLGMVADLWGPIGGWLTQAHTVRHYDKREKNKQKNRQQEIENQKGR